MTEQSAQPAQVLSDLSAMPADRRSEYLASFEDPRLMEALADEAERLIIADLSQAVNASRVLLPLAAGERSDIPRIRLLRTLGQALAYANQFEESMTHLHASAELALNARLSLEAARAQLTSIHVLARLGRYDEAINAGEAAHEAFLSAGEAVWAAKADVNLGVTLRMRDDPAAALVHFDRASAALDSQPTAAAQLDSNRAEALLDLSRFAEAEEAFLRALESFERSGMHRGAAIVEGNLADLMSRQGRLDKALSYFERARRRLDADAAVGDSARLAAEKGEALASVGMYHEALEDYRRAIPALRECGMVWEAARATTGMARIMLRLGRPNDARDALQASSDAFSQLQHRTGLGQVRLLQGETADAMGDVPAASTLFAEALELLADRPALTALVRQCLARTSLERGNLVECAHQLAKALDTAAALRLAPLLGDLLHERARLELAHGHREPALADLRAATDHIDRLRGTLQADRFRAAFLGRRASVFEDLVQTLLTSSSARDHTEAFAVVERAKNRSLLDMVAGALDLTERSMTAADDPQEKALLARLGRIRADLNAIYCGIDELGQRHQHQVIDQSWTARIEQHERDALELEDRLAATRGSGGLFAAAVGLSATQSMLANGTALIEYFVIGDQLIAFVVTNGRMEVFPQLSSMDLVVEAVERVQFQISRAVALSSSRGAVPERMTRDAQRELGDLHRMVLAPMCEAIGPAKRIIVAPHGALHAVPFHALWDGRQYAIERWEFTCAPSASILAHLRARASHMNRSNGPALLIGVSDTMAPRIEHEIVTVGRHLKGHTALLGEQATLERVQALAPEAGIIHFATHGRFVPMSPASSGLRLFDRWMTVRDLCGMRLKCGLATLSGCDTGMSAVHHSDETAGLMRGFLAAGTSAILTSLWSLSDETAEKMMASVYGQWHNGCGGAARLADVLRRCQRAELARQPHPAFWAPFVLVGEV